MNIRKVKPEDRELMLTSFKPMFGDWDYLPLVIDDWLSPSTRKETWVARADDGMLIAMGQAFELEPGDWYLGGLRSNSNASPHQVAVAILGLTRGIAKELGAKDAKQVRYGTLETFSESLRLAAALGFTEHFRLHHSHHPLPDIPEEVKGLEVDVPETTSGMLEYFMESSMLKPVHGYFFTWWDTQRLRERQISEALENGLLFKASRDGEMIGAAMFTLVPWQEFLVLSIMVGDDGALRGLYRTALITARRNKCNAIGMVHPSKEETNRRQKLFGLGVGGMDTVQLIRVQENHW